MTTGIDLILMDHERVNDLFASFEETGDASYVGQILDTLVAHDDAEQAALYPLAGHVLGDISMIARAAAAHSLVKQQMDLIRSLEGTPLTLAVKQLQQLVTAHVKEEETKLLPALAEKATPAQLDGLAARIEQAKQRVG
ncbi:MAG TPA: hemerythrin domain-containing protein [Ilumatobacteraceae bacterium]|jgi:hemerythrin superfamily protein